MPAVEVAVVGAGPAGMAAALQLRRYGIQALTFEALQPGGLLLNANLVENYPGFPGGIPGASLAERFIEQACRIGIELLNEEVLAVAHSGRGFDLLSDRDTYQARCLVLATGTRPRIFPARLTTGIDPQRVRYEVYPLRHVTGSQIAIVGAGDAAFDYALELAGRGNHVTILNRSEQIKSLPLLRERMQNCESIAYLPCTEIVKITALGSEELLLECVSVAGKMSLHTDYLIGALGRTPRDELLSGLPQVGALQAGGYLHLVGDIHNGICRQTAIAVGDGLRVAMKIYQHLQEA